MLKIKMINFIQLHQNITDWESTIITDNTWESIYDMLTSGDDESETIISFIHKISIQYNIDKKTILKQYFDYIIRNKPEEITPSFLNVVEVIIHSNGSNMNHILQYFVEHTKTQK
jgi:hypothetical protein